MAQEYLPSLSSGVFGSFSFTENANPPQAAERRFIFGYGSLMNTLSRNASIKVGKAYPCRVHYLKRFWNRCHNPEKKDNKVKNDECHCKCDTCCNNSTKLQPYLGVIFTNNKNDSVNGVIYQVNDEMIAAYDERELKWGYTRATLSKQTNHPQLFNKVFTNNINIGGSNCNCVLIDQKDSNKVDINDNDTIYLYELPILYQQLLKYPTMRQNILNSNTNGDKNNNIDHNDDNKLDANKNEHEMNEKKTENENEKNYHDNENQNRNKKWQDSQEMYYLRENPQVYIDICTMGCFEYSIDFAIEFIQTTYDWRYKWCLDRSSFRQQSRTHIWTLKKKDCCLMDQFIAKYLKKCHCITPIHLKKYLKNDSDNDIDNDSDNCEEKLINALKH